VLDLPENWSSIEYYWVPAEYWQYADVDTEEEFKFAELVMEYNILKGRGIDVYEDYRKSWAGPAEYTEDELNGMLSKYGNVNQIGG
jgi:hypothetical protein